MGKHAVYKRSVSYLQLFFGLVFFIIAAVSIMLLSRQVITAIRYWWAYAFSGN